ncbi:MAG TPA: TrmJ/YjtD family RNA methyltransferase [Candidatus Nanopusillus sp.]|nr:TrmJ/YjtD family RNA methyltransferase [Candidatus Nanopusillus sp.]
MDVSIVFVEPESEDNVGALARVMVNFDFKKLVIVNPQVNIFSEKVRIVARKKGWEIINNAMILENLEDAISMFDLTYGTAGISSKKGSKVLRNPLTPEDLAKMIWKYDGRIGIFFGRESTGFSNKELNMFDSVITIPANEDYPVMNVTHAAAVILYELFKHRHNPVRKVFKLANRKEKKTLINLATQMIEVLPVQDYRKPVMIRVLKNLIGKSMITEREYSVLAGIFRIVYETLKYR